MIRVAAAVVTHRRAPELRRLLTSLTANPPVGCVIADHAPDGSVEALARESWPFPAIVRADPSNPGPGAGWANAASDAIERFDPDAILFLDDDVVLPPGSIEALAGVLRPGGTWASAPLLEDAEGRLWAFPEPVPPPLRLTIRECAAPADVLAAFGPQPMSFCWCTGACMMVSREAITATGFHRSDFWMLGEDIDYSMRLATGDRAVFLPAVSVPHLPPPASSPEGLRKGDYVKFCSLLQNLGYLSFHTRHSRHMRNYLAGNFRRFFRSHGLSLRTVRDAATCFRAGILVGEPAGAASGCRLRERIRQHDDR